MIFPVALALPAAYEAYRFGKYVNENSEEIKEKILNCKPLNIKSCKVDADFVRRCSVNVSLVLALGASVSLPFVFLPLTLAIPLAMLGFCGSVDLLVNKDTYVEKAKEKWINMKKWFHDTYFPRENETKEAARYRISKNVALTVLALAAIGAASYGVASLVLYAVHMISSGAIGTWNVYDILPGATTKLGVFAWYGALGVVHGGMACYQWKQGKKKEAAFHMFAAALSIIFPASYLLTSSSQMRLHHSFLGLALMLVPFKPVRFLGGIITFDAGMNVLFNQFSPMAPGFDFMNIVLDHLVQIVATLSALSGIEYLRKRVFPAKEKEKEEVKPLLDQANRQSDDVVTVAVEAGGAQLESQTEEDNTIFHVKEVQGIDQNKLEFQKKALKAESIEKQRQAALVS